MVHGWGHDADMWQPLMDAMPDHDFTTVELGFTGKPIRTDLPDEDCIVVGHSLGSLWLLKHWQDNFKGFVSIGGFDCFFAHVPEKTLAQMKRNLARNAEAQMAGFGSACGLDGAYSAKRDEKRLAEGLEWLSQWDERDRRLKIPVLALAAKDDVIVPPKMTKAIWGDDVGWIEYGGHSLPLTKPAIVKEKIESFGNDGNL